MKVHEIVFRYEGLIVNSDSFKKIEVVHETVKGCKIHITTSSGDETPTADLMNNWNKLNKHLMNYCEFGEEESKYVKLNKLKLKEVAGQVDCYEIMLLGHKVLEFSNKVLPLNPPTRSEKFKDDDTEQQSNKVSKELSELIRAIMTEVIEYLGGAKLQETLFEMAEDGAMVTEEVEEVEEDSNGSIPEEVKVKKGKK